MRLEVLRVEFAIYGPLSNGAMFFMRAAAGAAPHLL